MSIPGTNASPSPLRHGGRPSSAAHPRQGLRAGILVASSALVARAQGALDPSLPNLTGDSSGEWAAILSLLGWIALGLAVVAAIAGLVACVVYGIERWSSRGDEGPVSIIDRTPDRRRDRDPGP